MIEDTRLKFQHMQLWPKNVELTTTYTPSKYRQTSDMILRIQLPVDFNTVLLFAKYNNARYLQF